MLNWNKRAIVVFSEHEADVLALQNSGYRAGLLPEDNEPLAKELRGEHYIIMANGRSKEVSQKWAAAGLCPEWQISIADYHGHQDLSHVAAIGGREAIEAVISNAKSIYHEEEHAFYDIPPRPQPKAYHTGWRIFDPYLRWTLPEFVVVVGPYGSGKSALAQMLACDFADTAGRELGATASICAWEDQDWRVKRNIERFSASRDADEQMEDVGGRNDYLLQNVRHITLPATESRSLAWYFQRCELQMRRYNTRFFVFDPWNEFDHVRDPGENETEYVNKACRELRAFSDSNGVNMVLVSHVSGKSFNDDGTIKPFRVAQTHGSSNYGKKCDRGICVMRTKQFQSGIAYNPPVRNPGESEGDYATQCKSSLERHQDRMVIRFDKSKDEETMGEVGVIAVKFDRDGMSITHDPMASSEAEALWKY